MSIVLGCVADDFTGATDLASTLVERGMRTVQLIGVPGDDVDVGDADAVVVALKSRTAPVSEAIAESVAALDWLRARGSRQHFFKYCSTFDSTPEGNIGPVADALLDHLGADFSVACPAFPETGRTIYKGHLFVGDRLLSESGMENHPLTPMTDADLVRVLGAQTPHLVGRVEHSVVAAGSESIVAAFEKLRADGARYAIVDALADVDLEHIGRALDGLALVTGGSGVALGLPDNYRRHGWLGDAAADGLPPVTGKAAVLSGSCSIATRGQVAYMSDRSPSYRLDPLDLAADPTAADAALEWALPRLDDGPVLVYATADPEAVARAQEALGRDQAGAVVEAAMARIARGLHDAGVRRLVVAGGETSGAVVGALGVTGLRIGPRIDPGVPCTTTLGEPTMALALKSGNFGGEDFFSKALGRMP